MAICFAKHLVPAEDDVNPLNEIIILKNGETIIAGANLRCGSPKATRRRLLSVCLALFMFILGPQRAQWKVAKC